MTDELGVSVIIPTYNRATLVPRAVRSALAAISPQDEVIVIDDGSSDGTEDALAPFRGQIRYIRLANGGAGRARNVGIEEATRELVAFLDSDDEWMPDKLQLQRALMQSRSDVLFSFSEFAVREETGLEIRRYLINWHNDPRDWSEILRPGSWFSSIASLPQGRADFLVHVGDLFDAQMAALYVFTSTLVVRAWAAETALRFAEDIGIYEDWECYGRLARTGLGAFLDTETVWNHGHSGGRLTDARGIERIDARIKVLERVWGSDVAYRERADERYRKVLREQRVLKVKELLWAGRVVEARTELGAIPRAPLSCRVLAAFPGSVAQGLLQLRHALR